MAKLNYNGRFNLLRFPGFKLKAVTASYDDGLKSDAKLIEIFKNHNIKATFNVNSTFMTEEDERGDTRYNSSLKSLDVYSNDFVEVACHGAKHIPVDRVDSAVAVNDLVSDRVSIEKTFRKVVKGLAYANGLCDENSAILASKCGFSYARTINQTESFELPTNWLLWDPTTRNISKRFFELAEEFISLEESKYFWFNEPKLFYFWGHSFEFSNDNDWQRMDDFCKLFDGHDEIWRATNGEIYEYVTAFDRLEFSADGSFVRNPSAVDVYVKYFNNKSYVIEAGKTVELK